jgi:hypothetical protein
MVLYEVEGLDALTSDAYLDRLNNPSPWTARIMSCYRGMHRGFCSILGSFGLGTGHACALIRFKPDPAARVHHWLLKEAMPALPSQPGLGSVHLLRGVSTPSMTNEQRLRGADGRVHSALIVTGYDRAAVEAAAQTIVADKGMAGAEEATLAIYEIGYSLERAEI